MKLSVFITSYKFKDYIKSCVDSVLSQKVNFDMEVIIRDDGTNDGTYENLVSLYGNVPNVKILDSSENIGAVKNLLTCMAACKGKYLAHIDGDDILIDDNHYQRAVEYLEQNPEYSLFCAGYRYLENDSITPETYWLCSGKLDIELKDLLVENYVSSGRVFKNIKMDYSIFDNIIYPDWAFNFEILKKGKAVCDNNHCVYLYRIHDGGMFSKKSEEEKQANKKKMIEILSDRFQKHMHKTITIVDSFVHNDRVKEKLINALTWLKEDGHEVLLITNTAVDKQILSNTKFTIYDSRNQLFKQEYETNNTVDFWKSLDDNFEMHDIVTSVQKHGLSVLINLFNAVHYAKQQGYTHFQRFEVDDLFGEKSREWIKKIPSKCAEVSKRGLIYYNDNHTPPDISFHYFFCEIDYFLSKINRIACEEDYIKYLYDYYGNKEFRIVEVFIRDQLRKNGDDDILHRTGEDMVLDFADSKWNTETSVSNFETTFFGCTTKIYIIKKWNESTGQFEKKDDYVLLTYSYNDSPITRDIEVGLNDGSKYNLQQSVAVAGGWIWHVLPANTKVITVYQDGNKLYSQSTKDVVSYVGFRK